MTGTSSQKLTPIQAQRIMLDLLAAARRQIDLAARAPLARKRAAAFKRLERALAALADRKTE